jgi:hypothetical protein
MIHGANVSQVVVRVPEEDAPLKRGDGREIGPAGETEGGSDAGGRHHRRLLGIGKCSATSLRFKFRPSEHTPAPEPSRHGCRVVHDSGRTPCRAAAKATSKTRRTLPCHSRFRPSIRSPTGRPPAAALPHEPRFSRVDSRRRFMLPMRAGRCVPVPDPTCGSPPRTRWHP